MEPTDTKPTVAAMDAAFDVATDATTLMYIRAKVGGNYGAALEDQYIEWAASRIDAKIGLPALIALLRRMEEYYLHVHGEPVNHNVNPGGPPIGIMGEEHSLIMDIREALVRLEGEPK